MWNEAVIAGIAHGGIEKPVDHQGAGVLVHLVFDRLAADRHLDDDIDLTRRIGPDRDSVNAHGWLRGGFDGFAVRSWTASPGQQVLDRTAEAQLVQAKATLSSDFGPNFSEERATMRPPSAR